MEIDKKTYKVKNNNRHKTQSLKTQIMLGLSLRKDNHHITHLQHKEFGKTKCWNTFTISRDGTIYQHFDPKYHSNFILNKRADKQSISIVLENMGVLFKTPEEKYINWLNEECIIDNVREKKWLLYQYWEDINEKQLNAAVDLCLFLCEKFGIPPKLIEHKHYNKNVYNYKGILFKSNYIEDSGEINPFFNIGDINQRLDLKSINQEYLYKNDEND